MMSASCKRATLRYGGIGRRPKGKRWAGAVAPAPFFIGLLLLVPMLALCIGCRPAQQHPGQLLYTFEGSTMGTYYVVKVVESEDRELDSEGQEQLLAVIEQELGIIDRLMSTYREDSELSRFNNSTSTEIFPVSAETATVVATALELGELTSGALDVTIGPLVNAWGFGPELSTPPAALDPERLKSLLSRIGPQHLSVGTDELTKALPDLYVDLSSLAKGFAIDRVVETIEGLGHVNLMVELGGEVRTLGTNLEGKTWRLGIERPTSASGQVQRIVHLDNQAMATSGDYRIYREQDGVRLSHLIDPRTGHPIGHRLASVSVIHESCMWADGLATALMILGPDEALAFADREGLPALFLIRDGEQFREQPSRVFKEQYMPEVAGST